MNAPYKHRRTDNPSTAFPVLQPGEIAVNMANRQLAVGDGTSALPLLGVRLFDDAAIYFEDDLIAHGGEVLRAIGTLSPGAFDPADWESTGGGGTAADIINVPAGGVAATDVQAAINELDTEKAPVVHTHTIAQVTGLQTSLDGKAPTVHTHAIADVTGLQGALDGKALVVHTHAIADVTGLQPALDAKAPLASPALTGAPTAPTPAALDDTTKIATTEFANHAARLMNTQIGTAYTLVLTDSGKLLWMFNAGAITLTVPPNSAAAFPIGAQIDVVQAGIGVVAVAAGAGVTLVSEDGKLRLTKVYTAATLVKVAIDTWFVCGAVQT